MEIISSKQRKILERFAQPMGALVIVGGAGVTEQVSAQVGRCLADHELIKIKFNEYKDEKKTLTAQLATENDATIVRIIGNVAILYRPAEKMKERRFEKALQKN